MKYNNTAKEWELDFLIRIEMAMDEQGFTVSELADVMHASNQTVHNWVSGRVMPSAAALPGLCLALGVSSDWLLGMAPKGGTKRWGGSAREWRRELEERQRAQLEDEALELPKAQPTEAMDTHRKTQETAREQTEPDAPRETMQPALKDKALAFLENNEHKPAHETMEDMMRLQNETGKTYGQLQAQKYIAIQRKEMGLDP